MSDYRRKLRAASTRCASIRRQLLVTDLDHVELLDSARSRDGDGIALACLDERPRHRRSPADVAAAGVDLVDADDAHGPLFPAGARHDHGRAEKDLIRILVVAPREWIDDLRVVEPPDQEADASIDLAQTLLAILVVGVLGGGAVA